MRRVEGRVIADPEALAAVVVECLPHLEPGLTLLSRASNAGEVVVDVTARDARGRLVLIVCDVVAGPETVLRALEGVAFWREHPGLARRLFAGAGTDGAGPRAFAVATRFTDRALRLCRALGAVAPVPVECRVLTDPAHGAMASLHRVDRDPTRAGTSRGAAMDDAARAAALIGELERLRFGEVFR